MDPGVTVPVDRAAMRTFAAAALRDVGARPSDARLTADTLVLADGRGHPSHGVSRLRQYLRLCDAGSAHPAARYEVLVRRTAMESWHGHQALGPAVGHRAMDRAIARARRTGLAAVVVRDTSHYGIAGAYVLRAMEAGMIGISSCNADPRVPPTGAAAAGIGTNPIAIGAPDGKGRGFLLDMATSVVAMGKVEIQKRAGRPIPDGWALDPDGRPTRDPDEALSGGMILPLGGMAETSGYKGYGLGAAMEMLTGVLGGGEFGLMTPGIWDTHRSAGINQFHMAIDPATFGAQAFAQRLRAWHRDLTALRRQPGVDEILVAGDPEWRADARQADTIAMLASTVHDLAAMAVDRGLRRAWQPVLLTAE
jgi:L-2-hydroxycarboxylate dehydrogenase (NAD+)